LVDGVESIFWAGVSKGLVGCGLLKRTNLDQLSAIYELA
jgi:hypothetical protein